MRRPRTGTRGRWRLRLESTGAPAISRIRAAGSEEWSSATEASPSVDVTRDHGDYEIVVAAAPGDTAYVSRVVLERP